MFHVARSQLQPIGLDIGHDSVKMLQVEIVNNTLSVVAAARAPFGPEVRADPSLRLPAVAELVRQMLRQQPFQGRSVIAALPREIVHVKNLRLPSMPVAELEAAIQFESPNIFPFNVEKTRVHFLPAGEVRQGSDLRQEVIVMAAKDDDVANFLELLHRAGVLVESLDVEPCALFRTIDRFVRRREDEQEVNVIIDIGLRRSLVVIGRGRDINFTKPIDIGTNHFHEAVARKLGITLDEAQSLRQRLLSAENSSDAGSRRDPVRQAVFDATRPIVEDLGREISLCLRYYSVAFRGQRPGKIRLVGGDASNPQLQSLLNTALAVPVEACKPFFSIDTSRLRPVDRTGPMSEWTLAFGLSLKLTKGPFAPRDGKPRDPDAPPPELSSPGAQLVDTDALIHSIDAAAPKPAASRPSPEAANA